MNENSIDIVSRSEEDTRSFGERIGRALLHPALILLTGDLGSGKTAFVQGLGKGLDVFENYYITSPSYTLVNEYPGRIPIYHVDLYRLNGPDDFENTGIDDILADENHVIAVEWADRLDKSYGMDHLKVTFKITDQNSRTIRLSCSESRRGSTVSEIIKQMRVKTWR
jgi:tRNA threonylcarbamoyladenosine biosynthesis protein TsaE